MSLTLHINAVERFCTMKALILKNMLMKDLNSAYFDQFSTKQENKTHPYLTFKCIFR